MPSEDKREIKTNSPVMNQEEQLRHDLDAAIEENTILREQVEFMHLQLLRVNNLKI